ncbi:hypothetical protein MMC34_000057 [Xylographa carneopallida]|nr:hypothetical protein [Xylographa carneopallida]
MSSHGTAEKFDGAQEVNKTGTPKLMYKEQDDDIQRIPIFCTADIPTEILDSLLEFALPAAQELNYTPTLLTTTSTNPINPPPISPIQPFTSPFLNWPSAKVYRFFLSAIQPLSDELSGPWPAHTFLIFDACTVADQTCLLCSDAPDFMEEGPSGAEDHPERNQAGAGGGAVL